MASYETHWGIKFTPTTHQNIPANIDPTKTKLPSPFVVAVTGAGKGLGYNVSLAYAKAGASGISISSRTQADLDKLEKEINAINPKAEVLKSITDTQKEESVLQLEKDVRSKWGRVDAVIANAGIISKYLEKKNAAGSNLPEGIVEDEDWARVLDINLLGSWRIAKAFMPLLSETKDGPQTLIVNTSMACHNTASSFTPIAYNISKIACNRLVEHISNDHYSKDGVVAYALHPGAVVTPQTEGHQGKAWDGDLLSDDPGLAGAFSVWLSKSKKDWLSGRYLSCNWDVDELEKKKGEIVKKDLLKFRMSV